MDDVSPQLRQVLSEFGLSPAETQVYLQSLALGPRSATVLAQKAGLKRGTTYNVLSSLLEKGIAQEYVRGGVKQFVCNSPEKLLGALDQRMHSMRALSEKLRLVLPELEQIQRPLASSPKVRFFQGMEGIREAMDELLSTGEKQIRAVFDLRDNWTTHGGASYPWVQKFIERRVELGIRYYGIVNHWNPDDYIIREQASQLRELRLAPGMEFPAELMICGHQVVLLSPLSERMGIFIDSASIASTLWNMHVLLWSSLGAGQEPLQSASTVEVEREREACQTRSEAPNAGFSSLISAVPAGGSGGAKIAPPK